QGRRTRKSQKNSGEQVSHECKSHVQEDLRQENQLLYFSSPPVKCHWTISGNQKRVLTEAENMLRSVRSSPDLPAIMEKLAENPTFKLPAPAHSQVPNQCSD
ncbi:MAG: hypothetical protein ACPGPS_07740, partial [Rubripirellula sp.]